jgi:hypothetical protein
MGLINKIKSVMAFSAKNLITKDKVEEPTKVPLPSTLNLNKSEVETLLMMIKETHFKGEHIQKIYELALKLQTYYTQLP